MSVHSACHAAHASAAAALAAAEGAGGSCDSFTASESGPWAASDGDGAGGATREWGLRASTRTATRTATRKIEKVPTATSRQSTAAHGERRRRRFGRTGAAAPPPGGAGRAWLPKRTACRGEDVRARGRLGLERGELAARQDGDAADDAEVGVEVGGARGVVRPFERPRRQCALPAAADEEIAAERHRLHGDAHRDLAGAVAARDVPRAEHAVLTAGGRGVPVDLDRGDGRRVVERQDAPLSDARRRDAPPHARGVVAARRREPARVERDARDEAAVLEPPLGHPARLERPQADAAGGPAMSPPPHATSTPRIEIAQTGDAPGSSIGSEHSFAPSSVNTRIVASWQPQAARSPSQADHVCLAVERAQELAAPRVPHAGVVHPLPAARDPRRAGGDEARAVRRELWPPLNISFAPSRA